MVRILLELIVEGGSGHCSESIGAKQRCDEAVAA